jgi:hypothetical protein
VRTRAGLTLVEVLVSLAAGAAVIAVAVATFSGGWKMGRVAEGSAILTGTALLETLLVEDLAQLGVDPSLGRVMNVADSGVDFYKVSFTPGQPGPLRLSPVRYRLAPTPRGNQMLTRTADGVTRGVAGIVMRGARFEALATSSAQMIRLSGTLIESDEATLGEGAFAIRALPITFVIPLSVSEDAANPALSRALALDRAAPL